MSFTQAVRSLQNVMKNIHTIILTKAVSRFISSKCCILEEELKTVIAATRSLEAQVEKVRRACLRSSEAKDRGCWVEENSPSTRLFSKIKVFLQMWLKIPVLD